MDMGMLHAYRSVTVIRHLEPHWHRRKNNIKIDIKNRM
jgi:hypothetical protein